MDAVSLGQSYYSISDEGPARKRLKTGRSWPNVAVSEFEINLANPDVALLYLEARKLAWQVARGEIAPVTLVFPQKQMRVLLQRKEDQPVRVFDLWAIKKLNEVFDMADSDDSICSDIS